jgi:AcrR family transcriptional regulator
LSEDRVIVEAERIADEVGLTRLTLAALAESLGVRQPSLYKHIDGMDDLQRSIAIRAKIELGDVLGRAAVGKSGDDAIRAIAAAYRRWAIAHPGRYSATVRAPEPEDADDLVVGIVLDILEGYDIHDTDAIDATRAIRSTLHGFIALESAGGFGLPVDIGRSFDRLVDGLILALNAIEHPPIRT